MNFNLAAGEKSKGGTLEIKLLRVKISVDKRGVLRMLSYGLFYGLLTGTTRPEIEVSVPSKTATNYRRVRNEIDEPAHVFADLVHHNGGVSNPVGSKFSQLYTVAATLRVRACELLAAI